MTEDIKIYISMNSLRTIFLESERSREKETGGAFIGTVSGNKIYLLEACGPGPGARYSSVSFSPDPQYLENFVNYFEEKGFLFVGQWHKHPPHIQEPSGGDKDQILEIFNDNPHMSFFVNIISNPIELGYRLSATLFLREEKSKFGLPPRIKKTHLFLENDAAKLSIANILAEKIGSDIVIGEIDTSNQEIPPTDEGYSENLEAPDTGFSKGLTSQYRLREGRKKGLVEEVYGEADAFLKQKILYEKKLMEILFPEFKLRVNKTPPKRFFWFSTFYSYQIALVLEKDGTYTVLIDPELEKIDFGGNVLKSALVAALLAKASILSKQLS